MYVQIRTYASIFHCGGYKKITSLFRKNLKKFKFFRKILVYSKYVNKYLLYFEDTDIASNPTSKVQSHSCANNKSFPQKS